MKQHQKLQNDLEKLIKVKEKNISSLGKGEQILYSNVTKDVLNFSTKINNSSNIDLQENTNLTRVDLICYLFLLDKKIINNLFSLKSLEEIVNSLFYRIFFEYI